MFVRKKTNRSGTISIVVVSKAHGKFTEVKKFGVAKSEEEADEMFREAQLWLRTHDGQQSNKKIFQEMFVILCIIVNFARDKEHLLQLWTLYKYENTRFPSMA